MDCDVQLFTSFIVAVRLKKEYSQTVQSADLTSRPANRPHATDLEGNAVASEDNTDDSTDKSAEERAEDGAESRVRDD